MTAEQKEAILQAFYASGYERGEAAAAEFLGMVRGFLHGVAPLLEAYAAAQNVTETITDEPDSMERGEAGEKTDIGDCVACLCNTCANIEKCVEAPDEFVIGISSMHPYPCDGCEDGMRFLCLESKCAGYVQGEENNE